METSRSQPDQSVVDRSKFHHGGGILLAAVARRFEAHYANPLTLLYLALRRPKNAASATPMISATPLTTLFT